MDPRISLLDRLKLQLRGYVYLEERIEPDWKEPLPFYAFKCPVHGLVESYPQGYEKKLVCPKCVEELKEEMKTHEEEASVDALLMDAANEAMRTVEV
ncbi:hypothetical protein JXL21_12365 [Candidatus Bathyarchaeota archaeon]|nr:hypothetical protein [Candidatus Bathyarchaeota archaeon]